MAAAPRQKRRNKSTAVMLLQKKAVSMVVMPRQKKPPASTVVVPHQRRQPVSTAVMPRRRKAAANTAVQLRPASPSTDPNNRAPKLSVYGVRGFHAQAYARLIALLASTLIRFFTLTALLSAGTLRAEPVDPAQYYSEDIKTAMQLHVDAIVDANGDWSVIDDQTGERLTLRFMQVHDPVRQISQTVYFACTDFHVKGNPDQVYDMDFWLEPVDGTLKVFQTKVHKEPRHALLYGWYKHPRYTFVNDEISYLYD